MNPKSIIRSKLATLALLAATIAAPLTAHAITQEQVDQLKLQAEAAKAEMAIKRAEAWAAYYAALAAKAEAAAARADRPAPTGGKKP